MSGKGNRKEQKKRYKLKHRDKYLAEKKRYNEKHKEQRREYMKRYCERNRIKLNKLKREYNQQNPDQKRGYKKKWKKTPQGRISRRLEKIRRREKEKGAIHQFTKKQWFDKMMATDGICPICGLQFDDSLHQLTLDHNPPLSKVPKGFIYTIDMVKPICLSCNSKKGNRI